MAPQGGQQGGGSMISTLIMFAAIFAIFYFMIIRPQQKRQKEKEKMLSQLKKGDKIMTSGGIYGTIAGMDDKTVLVEVDKNVKIKFDRSAITVVNPKDKQNDKK
ncbi:MAG: preprotein translocase subunit YajC [Ignavibacteria bacterium]|nr:MAG: preprotein translocase subunit YajC [Ignavibacteria bacterium]